LREKFVTGGRVTCTASGSELRQKNALRLCCFKGRRKVISEKRRREMSEQMVRRRNRKNLKEVMF